MKNPTKAILYLEDGLFFIGQSFGARGEMGGEICFNTGMTGYQEILTDPSYARQIIVMCSPHIGNTGTNPQDMESEKIHASGLVVRSETENPSSWRSTASLNSFLNDHDLIGLSGIDTRALTIHIRLAGAMNGILSTEDFNHDSLREKCLALPSMAGSDLTGVVTVPATTRMPATRDAKFHVAVLDFGCKHTIYTILREMGADLTVFPASTPAGEILAAEPDGVFLSNGPGDPAAVTETITTVRTLIGQKPLFGICLGHQILALALGGSTFKLKFGHRGINHPVRDLSSGRVEITSQNHGFAVDPESLPEHVRITHLNLNDNTVAGISCHDRNAYSVQYHPEACPGPHDSRDIFTPFFTMMEENAKTS